MIRATLIIVISLGALAFINGQEEVKSSGIPNLADIAKMQGLNISDIEKGTEDAKTILRKKCEKNGGPDAFDNAYNAKDNITTCMENLINIKTLQEEIRVAGPTGDVDLVFKKYCDKKPQFLRCITNFMDKLSPCLEQSEKDNYQTVNTAMDSLFDFVCHKEGERIALFISVGGPECVMEKAPKIQDCLNTTYGSNITLPTSGFDLTSFNSLPALSFGLKECEHLQNLKTCSVKSLEECKDTTPGNMADALFKFLDRATPCQNVRKEKLLNAQAQSAPMSLASSLDFMTFLIIPAFLLGFM
ncbi:hypothetical protein HCN44_004637 [Aphidius gifuensis]|uniref:Odorant-binding protein n=1 Tax=Aphidius gifuensis TaxID=684658 RepID=A0A835CW78_APHGI|nr:27 kDa hemolymph protein-like [Aphidius gifuensis]XP_044003410.1 27 kDa hemolymph protein-like [Aphidius gifuensis]KAF7995165.1 hypothetical protein HCN44_004637 [Aphidius gifuensis]